MDADEEVLFRHLCRDIVGRTIHVGRGTVSIAYGYLFNELRTRFSDSNIPNPW